MFPREFIWGAATAAFQIEGATHADGRGESIWDRFCHTPGKVANGDTGDVACDHYHRWPDDLDLMSSLGLDGYRFSIAWPRVQPDGRGPANPKGLDFYRRLVDGLLERGIAPLATLYHWDLPQRLQDEGGWASRDVVDRFAEYAQLVFDALDDRVDAWVTHNEPWVTSFLGYGLGVKAPGIKDWRAALAAAHHVLLSHGRAARAYREGGGAGELGITLDLTHVSGDSDAVRRLDGHRNRWFLDPVLGGSYPPDMLELYSERVGPFDFVHDGDLHEIAAPIDFLGVNFYQPAVALPGDGPLGVEEVRAEGPRTAMGWTVEPSALTALLLRLRRDYGAIPLVITENGASFDDPPVDGQSVVEDPERVAYLRDHIAAVERAVAEGVDVRGYYVWSLLDNFEWEHGYDSRFGIVAVDFDDQRRVPKRSALWYRDLIARHANGG
ncbi:MAG TPA: GH1 family beta-glucosidase [Gaiellaceae bacterium]|nr:GH1 family beta-glucosidase [Gaiellaceae bacterium]